ncbi:MAG TPA: hypothetical protein VKE69_07915, partial [Planctomycetota bacterium]|nr:hypothetical protein [Planctomycetota bacterium]
PDGSGAKLAALVVFHAGDPAAAEREAGIPVFAIGGLDAARIAAIGARRAAVSSAILDARDPLAAARAIRRALDGPQRSSIASPYE